MRFSVNLRGLSWLITGAHSLYFGPLGTVRIITVDFIGSILSGGRQMKVQSGLMLSKENLTFYKAYNVLKAK
ncbi:hypothetical protein cypCar_00009809, partial [Cyprinus carpio]